MVILISGNNNTASREQFLKSCGSTIGEKKHFEDGEKSFNDFKTTALSSSIFGDPLTVSAVFLKVPGASCDFSFLPKIPENNTVIILCNAAINAKSKLQSFATVAKAKILNFTKKRDDSAFNLVDALCSRNAKDSYLKLKVFIESGGTVLELTGPLSYQVRNMIAVSVGAEFVKSLRPFVLLKATKFSHNFTLLELKDCYQKILETDANLKNGLAEDIPSAFNLVELMTNR